MSTVIILDEAMHRSYTIALKTTKRQSAMLFALLVQLCELYNIKSLAQSQLSKSILDAAWRELLLQITYKAEEAGKWAVAVASAGTSQVCSGCGTKVPKKLGHRRYDCQNCGLRVSRDHNAAQNILALGGSAARVRAECLLK